MIRRAPKLLLPVLPILAVATLGVCNDVTPPSVDGVRAAMSPLRSTSSSGGDDRTRPHGLGFTEGYGNERVLAFLYPQQFFCTDEFFDDLDGPGHTGDGLTAAQDPDEFQFPAMGPPGSPCIIGPTRPSPVGGSLPTTDPAGIPIANVLKVWAILPFFDSSKDADVILEVEDPTRDGADVQCPEPGPPFTTHTGAFGTCTMHPSTLHVEPVVNQFGLPTNAPVGDINLPNHSHIIDGETFNPVWWQTIAVRVFDERIWPDFNGRCPANPEGGRPCLISVQALRDAQARGQAGPDTPSNVFLFFDSRKIVPHQPH
jgi:hypothetical protein